MTQSDFYSIERVSGRSLAAPAARRGVLAAVVCASRSSLLQKGGVRGGNPAFPDHRLGPTGVPQRPAPAVPLETGLFDSIREDFMKLQGLTENGTCHGGFLA